MVYRPRIMSNRHTPPTNEARRNFMRAAVAVGAAVGVTALAPNSAEAKRCLPVASRKPAHPRFEIEAEEGTVVDGRMDLDTVQTGVAPGGTGQVLTVELFFDRYEEGKSVREITDKVEKLALVHQELHRPPTALLTWGTGLAFRCTVEKVMVADTAFSSDGTPVGAVALVRFAILESCAL